MASQAPALKKMKRGLEPKHRYLRVRQILASALLTDDEKTRLRNLIAAGRPRTTGRGGASPSNGLGRCIVRVGRRVLIDETMFLEWLKEFREFEEFIRVYKTPYIDEHK